MTNEPLVPDTYEEYLHIIDDTSLRELMILNILRYIELNPEPYIDKSISEKEYLPHRYWTAFKEKVSIELTIPTNHIFPIMKRLERTGLFAMYNGFSFGAVEEGVTTDYYHDFYKYIISFDNNR